MDLDIREPLGWMFVLLGGLLAIYGLATGRDTALYARSLGVNINLLAGAGMCVFGMLMLAGAMRTKRRAAKKRTRDASK